MSAEPRRSAVVTGGARGIGLAIVSELIRQGFRVAVIDVNAKAVASVQQLPATQAGLLVPMQLSIVDRTAVQGSLSAFEDDFGPIHALVNNAGMTQPATFLDQDDEGWDRILDVNLKGTFVVSQVAARLMVPRKSGSIVNISSVSAHGVRTGPPAYAAAKAGVEGLTRLMAVQLGTHGIRANTVVVGTTATPWLLSRKAEHELEQMRDSTLLGHLGEPEDVAAMAAFLCSDAARHVTGQMVSVSGGQWIP